MKENFQKVFRLLKFVFTNYSFWLTISIIGILLDIFIFKSSNNLLILFLIGLWILSVYHFKFEGKVSIILGLFFIILCSFLLTFKKEFMAEKTAIWAYTFLVFGVAQMMIEQIKGRKKDVKKET